MKVAVYTRVSTEEQAKEGYSIPAQRERLTAYAISQNWNIYDFYVDEGWSAKNTERPELQRLLQDVREKKFDIVLVYKLDRLTRSVLDLYQLLHELDEYNVKFKSATEIYDTTTAIGRLFITLVAALAQWERENLGERTKFGKEEKARQGKRAGGKAPFGYDKIGEDLVVNESEAKIVRNIFDLYSKHRNMNTVADILFGSGITTKNKVPFSLKTIRDMLKNPLYIGTLRYNYTTIKGTVTSIRPPEEWIIVEDVLPAIIDKDIFNHVQKILESNETQFPRNITSTYIFSGIVTCPNCNHTLIGFKNYKSKKDKTKEKYYRCSFTKLGSCHNFSIKETTLEKVFIKELSKRTERITSEISRTGTKSMIENGNIPAYQKELEVIKQKKKRLQQMYLAEMIEIDYLKNQMSEFIIRENEVIAAIEEEKKFKEKTLSDEHVVEVIEHINKTWGIMSYEDKKQIVNILVKSISVKRDPKKPRSYHLTSLLFNK